MMHSSSALVYIAFLIVLIAISVKTLVVLRTSSPWTTAGWILSTVYALIACTELVSQRTVAPVWPYGALLLMVIAFVVAGIKDERQADPWWWPMRLGKNTPGALTRLRARPWRAR